MGDADVLLSDVKRLREREVENAKFKRMYADLVLENAASTDVLNPSRSCAPSLTPGSASTTASGPTTASGGYRR